MTFRLRHALATDAAEIARIMRASMASHEWMPTLHTPDEDLAYFQAAISRKQRVVVACKGQAVVGFIAMADDCVDHLHVDPPYFGRGIGSALLLEMTRGASMIWLYCFLENYGARRFYERHGFYAEAYNDGSETEEGLPGAYYVWRGWSR